MSALLHRFLKVKKMFREFNSNPRNKRVGDCVIRAISKALNKPWEDVYVQLVVQGYLMADLPSANAVWGAYLKNKGFSRDVVSADCPECYTVEDFCREHPTGIYILGTGTHAVCVINGDYFDTWKSGEEQPIYFYKKE